MSAEWGGLNPSMLRKWNMESARGALTVDVGGAEVVVWLGRTMMITVDLVQG